MFERLFLAVPWSCLRFVIVVLPDHTHLLFLVVDVVVVGYFSKNKTKCIITQNAKSLISF